MQMNRTIFIGDEVETRDGIGVVVSVNTWRDLIDGMSEHEAHHFNDVCMREIGPDYRQKWEEVFVRRGSRIRRYLVSGIKVLKGRKDER